VRSNDRSAQAILSEVSNVLWRERHLLELLIFKLEEEQLVLASGRTRWLAHSTREVETVLAEIKRVELDRAIQVQELAQVMQLASSPSLRELAETAPSPWDTLLGEHRRALLELAQEIDTVAQANREMLSRGQQATREALASTFGELDLRTYDPHGTTGDTSPTLRLIDEAM
jgi:flagellar biosynthesis/type III secretory pathway chaperone